MRNAWHALAIDETRADFDRVKWAEAGDVPDRTGEPEWLQQMWFAGNHSDIGGSYVEDESRLSNITLKWMVEQATSLPKPLRVDTNRELVFLCRRHAAQRDRAHARLVPVVGAAGAAPRVGGKAATNRARRRDSREVYERAGLPHVLHYAQQKSYRPSNLALHSNLAHVFSGALTRPA